MFHVVTGDGWPAADEDEVHDLGRLWLQVGAQLGEFAPEVTRSATYLTGSGALVGDGQRALAAAVGLVTGDGDLTLQRLAAGFEELGQYLQRVAVQTQYLKIVVIEELVILAAQIAYLVAMIPWTFGASAAGIASLQVFGRAFAVAVLRQLAIAIATGEVLQVGLDAIAQLAQVAEGWRGEWDGDLTRSAAITGVVGGVLGPVFQGLGHYPGRLLGKALAGVAGRVAGRNAGREAAGWAGDVVTGAGHEYVTDGTSSLVQGGGWRPDTFSLTAGASDEGATGLAGIGRRKRHLTTDHAPDLGLSAGSGKTPWDDLPDHLGLHHPADRINLRQGLAVRPGPTGRGSTWMTSTWSRSTGGVPDVAVAGRASRPEVPDLTGFWDPGPSHRVTVLDDDASQQVARQEVAASGDARSATGGVAGDRLGAADSVRLDGPGTGATGPFGEVASDHDITSVADPGPVLGAVAGPGPIEVEAGQTFTLDDLDPVPNRQIRRSDEEKLALLADYEQAISQRRGKAWLREHGLTTSHMSGWRRLRETAELPAGDPRLAAVAYSSLSTQQREVLVREYQDAVDHGQGQQWLTAKNLTRNRLVYWQTLVRSTQQQAVQPAAPQQSGQQAGPGDRGGPSEIFVDPAADFGRLLSPTDHDSTPSPASGAVAGPGPIEVEAGQTFTLDDLDPVPNRRIRRSDEEKLALLADYEQAASQLRGRAWLRERGIDARRICEWRLLRQTAALPAGDPRLAAVAHSSLTLQQKAGLVREYRDAVAHGQEQQWLTAKNLSRSRISSWQARVESTQQQVAEPAALQQSGQQAGQQAGLQAGQMFTLDDPNPVPNRRIRRGDEEKLALLADYEQAVSRRRGKVWLREHGIHPRRTIEWRRLRETAALPAGDPRLAAMASSSLTLQQKAGLVREYRDAVAHGQEQQWLTAKKLTRNRISRWEGLVRSTQQQAVQPAAPQQSVPGGDGGPSEIFVDPAADFGRLLSPTDHDTTSASASSPVPGSVPRPVTGPVTGPGLIEVEVGQTFTLDDLEPTRARPTQRSDEEKLALLAEYEQAASQLRGEAWLRERGINPGRTTDWRRLRELAPLPASDPRLAVAASSSLSSEQKAGLVRQYRDAVARGQGQQWLTARNLTRSRISRWQARAQPPAEAQRRSPGLSPGPDGTPGDLVTWRADQHAALGNRFRARTERGDRAAAVDPRSACHHVTSVPGSAPPES